MHYVFAPAVAFPVALSPVLPVTSFQLQDLINGNNMLLCIVMENHQWYEWEFCTHRGHLMHIIGIIEDRKLYDTIPFISCTNSCPRPLALSWILIISCHKIILPRIQSDYSLMGCLSILYSITFTENRVWHPGKCSNAHHEFRNSVCLVLSDDVQLFFKTITMRQPLEAILSWQWTLNAKIFRLLYFSQFMIYSTSIKHFPTRIFFIPFSFACYVHFSYCIKN